MRSIELDRWRQLEIATAAGGACVAAFWIMYFVANETLGLVEPAYASFEESFIVADSLFAALLFASSLSLHRRRAAGPFLLAMAASMSLYLGLLDATFYAQNGLFLPVTGAALFELLINVLCVGGGLYGLRAAWFMWSATGSEASS